MTTAVADAPLARTEEGGVVVLRLSRIWPYEAQPRKHFDEIELLGRSLAEGGQEDPVKAVPLATHPFLWRFVPEKKRRKVTHLLCDGERRYRAAKERGLETIEVREVSVADEKELFMRSARSNCNRRGHSVYEIALGVRRVTEEFGGTMQEAGECFGISAVTAEQYYEISRLDPRVFRMMDPSLPRHKRLRQKGIALALVGLSPDQQLLIAGRAVRLGLKTRAVAHLIEEQTGEKVRYRGGKGRRRRPSDDFREVSGRVTKAGSALSEVFRVEGLDRILRTTGKPNRKTLYTQLVDIEERAKTLRGRVRGAGV